jgi:hypothetical protein
MPKRTRLIRKKAMLLRKLLRPARSLLLPESLILCSSYLLPQNLSPLNSTPECRGLRCKIKQSCLLVVLQQLCRYLFTGN